MTENNAHELAPEDAALLDSMPEGEARDKLAARLAATYEGTPRTPRPDRNQGTTRADQSRVTGREAATAAFESYFSERLR